MSSNGKIALLAGLLLFSEATYAGPLLPCLSSTQSANGKVLVTSTLSFDDPDETDPRTIVSSVYQVYRRYTNLTRVFASMGRTHTGPMHSGRWSFAEIRSHLRLLARTS
jgi:hypothetical protein